MAERHPYVPSKGMIVQAVKQFRTSLPPKITSATLKKLSIAPNNESYLLNIFRFLGLIDEEGNPSEIARKLFHTADDQEFAKQFEAIVRDSYKELFDLHEDNAWKLDRSSLIGFFRHTDHTTDLVGQRQAATFEALAALSGHGDLPEPRKTAKRAGSKKTQSKKKAAPASKKVSSNQESSADTENGENRGESGSPSGGRDVGLSVRIEVNLPSDADQETYDRIFKSIRENLLNE